MVQTTIVITIGTIEGMKEYFRSVHDYACTERVKFAVREAVKLLKE